MEGLVKFVVDDERFRFLTKPTEFYDLILERSKQARHRINISTLYIGDKQTELIESLAQATQRGVDTRIITDYRRSLRKDSYLPIFFEKLFTHTLQGFDATPNTRLPSSDSTPVLSPGVTRNAMLEVPLVSKPPLTPRLSCPSLTPRLSRMSLSPRLSRQSLTAQPPPPVSPEYLKTTPQLFLFKVPERSIFQLLFPLRMQETLGVFHLKWYAFDDSIIITGANLSESYFTEREDRWMVIEDAKELVDFMCQLSSRLSTFSSQAFLQRGKGAPGTQPDDIILRLPKRPIDSLGADLMSLFMERNETVAGLRPTQRQALLTFGIHCGFDTSPFCEYLRNTETTVLTKALEADGDGGKLALASPYLNLSPFSFRTLEALIGKRPLEIMAASPSSSSFFEAGPVLSAVPFAYVNLMRQTLEKFKNHSVLLRLYDNPGRSYHCKGLWIFNGFGDDDSTTDSSSRLESGTENWHECPDTKRVLDSSVRTIIGSSNFSERSFNRDLECHFLLESSSPKLMRQLYEETERIRNRTVAASAQFHSWFKAPLITRLVASIFTYAPFFRSLL